MDFPMQNPFLAELGCRLTRFDGGCATVELELRDALQQGRTDDARWLTERLRWAHEPFLVGQDFMEFAKYNVPLEKIRVNGAGYVNVGTCRAPYTEDLVPAEHVATTDEHVARYAQIKAEVEARFGKRAPKHALAQV